MLRPYPIAQPEKIDEAAIQAEVDAALGVELHPLGLQQLALQLGADEARGAGDEHAHRGR